MPRRAHAQPINCVRSQLICRELSVRVRLGNNSQRIIPWVVLLCGALFMPYLDRCAVEGLPRHFVQHQTGHFYSSAQRDAQGNVGLHRFKPLLQDFITRCVDRHNQWQVATMLQDGDAIGISGQFVRVANRSGRGEPKPRKHCGVGNGLASVVIHSQHRHIKAAWQNQFEVFHPIAGANIHGRKRKRREAGGSSTDPEYAATNGSFEGPVPIFGRTAADATVAGFDMKIHSPVIGQRRMVGGAHVAADFDLGGIFIVGFGLLAILRHFLFDLRDAFLGRKNRRNRDAGAERGKKQQGAPGQQGDEHRAPGQPQCRTITRDEQPLHPVG